MTTYIYPGSFCPPTFGHVSIVKNVAEFVSKLIVICSVNEEKNDNWFTPSESKEMWYSYELPKNVVVMTLDEFKMMDVKSSDIIMIRGIRNGDDLEYEKKIALYNNKRFGITKYLYIFCESKYQKISSTGARLFAKDLELEKLSECVSSFVISRLLESVLKITNIFMVVGRPGSGKTTFLEMLKEYDDHIAFINTDEFNKKLKPFIQSRLATEDLISVALNDEELLKSVIKEPWMNLLADSLRGVDYLCRHLFIEVPYGMQSDKSIFRFLGGKILYIGCDEKVNISRVENRGTPELIPFIKKIPGLEETTRICNENKLNLFIVDTDCNLDQLKEKAEEFCLTILRRI